MKQTPVHDNHNPDLFHLIPKTSKFIVEVGCSSGALAREYKKVNQNTKYIGLEIDESYVNLAKRYRPYEILRLSEQSIVQVIAMDAKE